MESLPGYYMCHRVTYLLENSSAHKHKIILCVEVYHFDDLCYCRVELPVSNHQSRSSYSKEIAHLLVI